MNMNDNTQDQQAEEVKTEETAVEEPTHPSDGGKKVSKPVSKDLEAIIEKIEKLSVLELHPHVYKFYAGVYKFLLFPIRPDRNHYP